MPDKVGVQPAKVINLSHYGDFARLGNLHVSETSSHFHVARDICFFVWLKKVASGATKYRQNRKQAPFSWAKVRYPGAEVALATRCECWRAGQPQMFINQHQQSTTNWPSMLILPISVVQCDVGPHQYDRMWVSRPRGLPLQAAVGGPRRPPTAGGHQAGTLRQGPWSRGPAGTETLGSTALSRLLLVSLSSRAPGKVLGGLVANETVINQRKSDSTRCTQGESLVTLELGNNWDGLPWAVYLINASFDLIQSHEILCVI